MAVKINEFLIGLLSSSIETVGKSKLSEVLDKLAEISPEDYKSAVFGGHAFVKRLKPLADKSGTKVDNVIVDALHEALHESATKHNLELVD